jgi:hypothetical protein
MPKKKIDSQPEEISTAEETAEQRNKRIMEAANAEVDAEAVPGPDNEQYVTPGAGDDIQIRRKEQIPCQYFFTPDELRDIGDTLAQAVTRLDGLENDLKNVKAQFKADIEGLEAEIKKEGFRLRNKYEYRPIECDVIFNFSEKVIFWKRKDNGVVEKSRPMRPSDLQLDLPFNDFEKIAAAIMATVRLFGVLEMGAANGKVIS